MLVHDEAYAMCGRTSLAVALRDLEDRFDAHLVAGLELPARYNIAPRDDLAVVENETPEEIDLVEWGFLPQWADADYDGPRPINARSETVAEKSMFKGAFEERRCLILADGFYEWKGERGHKQPYRIERADGEPYAYAGLWETNEQAGEPQTTCTILTTDANETVAEIHDRMPCMLEPQHEATWLNGGDLDELQSTLKPYPDNGLTAFPVSKRVNNPANDSPDITEKIDIGEQSGLGDFGS